MLLHTEVSRTRAEADWLRLCTTRAFEELRMQLEHEYGWTAMDVTAAIRPTGKLVVLEGTVAVPAIATKLHRKTTALLPQGWRATRGMLDTIRGSEWRTIRTPVMRLWHQYEARPEGASLATELLAGDGPVQILARRARALLVRGSDGTVGWTHEPVGAPSAPRRPRLVVAARQEIANALRSRIGVAYRLGGTTSAGLDCSGLVQRVFRETVGMIVPRHSSDQHGYVRPARRAQPWRSGDLVFRWGHAEGPCHVGVVLTSRRAGATVVHASQSRGIVVEDALEAFLAGAGRIHHLPFERLVALWTRAGSL